MVFNPQPCTPLIHVGGTHAFEPELICNDAATLCLRIINKMAASLEAAAS